MKYSDKINAKNLIVIGEDELLSGNVKIKNMENGNVQEAKLDVDDIIERTNLYNREA